MLHYFNLVLLALFFSLHSAGSGNRPAFPAFSQQCQDDAGPRWTDDLEIFGQDKFYWSSSHARAVLNEDGTCPSPVEAACQTRKNPLQAFVEGPISCPDAWFCRIYPDPNHGAVSNFLGDRNFGNCDQPSGLWEDTNTDQDGHCHGGLDPSSYYWWVRDHWMRPYAGRVKCCCVDSMPLANGGRTMDLRGIANRCDYRAKVTVGADECRDANEDHAGGRMGSGFLYGFDGVNDRGCPMAADGRHVEYTKEPADEMCWEILNFGLPDDNDQDDSIYPTSVGPCTGAGSATGGSCDGTGNFSGPNDGAYVRPDGAPVVTVAPGTGAPEFTYPPSNPGNGNDAGEESSQDEGDSGDAEEPSQGNDDPQSGSDSQFYESATGSCPTGSYLRDEDLCIAAGQKFGYDLRRSFFNRQRTRGCYVKNGHLYFNRAAELEEPTSSDRKSICCASANDCTTNNQVEDDNEEFGGGEEENPSATQFVQSLSGSCSGGDSYITTEDLCWSAAESLNLEVGFSFSNAERVRGCYMKNGKLFFNRATSFTDASTSSPRKSICVGSERRSLHSGSRLLRL